MIPADRVRQLARRNEWQGSTRAAAPGHVQCNIVILPGEEAAAFAAWCRQNRNVAPILAISEPGDPGLPVLGEGIDVRLDLPDYRIFLDGCPSGQAQDIMSLWGDDWQAFAFGCSFSLEEALRSHNVPLSYEERGFGGAIYQTNIPSESVGRYAGPLIVSMRPIETEHVPRAVEVSNLFPGLHGAPVHIGEPEAIGVALDKPLEALGTLSVLPSEQPVFWACGVTTQLAIERAKPKIAVTHVSSRMLVTDLPIDRLKNWAGRTAF